jgi:hypothetical protein
MINMASFLYNIENRIIVFDIDGKEDVFIAIEDCDAECVDILEERQGKYHLYVKEYFCFRQFAPIYGPRDMLNFSRIIPHTRETNSKKLRFLYHIAKYMNAFMTINNKFKFKKKSYYNTKCIRVYRQSF